LYAGLGCGVHHTPGPGKRYVLVVKEADGDEQGVEALQAQVDEKRLADSASVNQEELVST
jgi:hypothetical protein